MSKLPNSSATDAETTIDYVDWCGKVLAAAIQLADSNPTIHGFGITHESLAAILLHDAHTDDGLNPERVSLVHQTGVTPGRISPTL